MRLNLSCPEYGGANGQAPILKLFGLFIFINALLYTIISIAVVAPELSSSLENLRQQDLKHVTETSSTHLNLYFDDRLKVVRDLSRIPHVINAAKLSSDSNPDLRDFMSSFNVLEQEPEVTLFNVAGDVIFTTPNVHHDVSKIESSWFNRINDHDSEVEFHLFSSEDQSFGYMIAVPVFYNHYVEGVLAVVLHGSIDEFSNGQVHSGAVLKLCQSETCVQTGSVSPDKASRIERLLSMPGASIEMVFDWSSSTAEYHRVSNSILLLMLGAAIVAFVLFAIVGYPIIVRPYQRLEHQRDELALLQSAMENAVEGVARLNEKGCYDFLNDAYSRLLGYGSGELSNQSWQKTVVPEETDAVKYALNSLNASGKVEVETIGLRKDGSQFHKQLTLIPVVESNHLDYSGHFCFMQDISDRKQAEMSLKKANEELESFAYRTSHDLRSPLVSAEGLLALTQRLMAKGNTEAAKEAIEKTVSSVKKLQVTIDDILTLSHSSHLEEDAEPCDVEVLIEDTLGQLAHHDSFSIPCLHIDLQHVGEVDTVKTRLQQIVSNLISNALKYGDAKSRPPEVRISSRSEGKELVLQIEDNGIGIPEESREKLFGMFQRFHSHYAYGSGLGLYLVKKNAEALGGSIRFEAPKHGTRFILKIPQRMEAA